MSGLDSLDSLNPLDDPATVTRVMQTPSLPLPVVPQHQIQQLTPPGLPAVPQPQAIRSVGAPQPRQETIMTGDPQHDRIIHAVTQVFQLRDAQARALTAGKEIDASEAKEKKKGRWTKIIIAALTILGGGGGGGAWYLNAKSDVEITNEEAIRRHEVNNRIGTVELQQNVLKVDVSAIETDLDTHIDDQRKENEADKLRSLRQQIMLETLLRSQGRRPPQKNEQYKAAERAVGIDPDDPLDEK